MGQGQAPALGVERTRTTRARAARASHHVDPSIPALSLQCFGDPGALLVSVCVALSDYQYPTVNPPYSVVVAAYRSWTPDDYTLRDLAGANPNRFVPNPATCIRRPWFLRRNSSLLCPGERNLVHFPGRFVALGVGPAVHAGHPKPGYIQCAALTTGSIARSAALCDQRRLETRYESRAPRANCGCSKGRARFGAPSCRWCLFRRASH